MLRVSLLRVCSRVVAKVAQLPRDSRHLASVVSQRINDLSDSLSDSWKFKKGRWPTFPTSPRTPSKNAQHPRQYRWEAKKQEVKKADDDCARTKLNGKPVSGDTPTDCIYTISIDGNVAYVGISNSAGRRTKEQDDLMEIMRLRNPGATVSMQPLHTGIKHGPQLYTMENYYMEMFDTLMEHGDSRGVGVNKFRYNERAAPRKINGKATSPQDAESYIRVHTCDGPSHLLCDGNALWTQESINTMIQETEAAQQIYELARIAMVSPATRSMSDSH